MDDETDDRERKIERLTRLGLSRREAEDALWLSKNPDGDCVTISNEEAAAFRAEFQAALRDGGAVMIETEPDAPNAEPPPGKDRP